MDPVDPAVVAALVAVIDDDEEAEQEEMIMILANIAAAELMELEEPGLGLAAAASWVKITVNINEYLLLGDACFKLHFRMSTPVFEILTQTLRQHLIDKGRLKRERTPFRHIILMVIWVLATPDTFRSIALRFGVVPSTLYYFYSYVIEALRELAPRYISWPDAAERQVIKERWRRATGFPEVIGSIDGTHVTITAPLDDPAQYRDRHHSYSIVVQAVVDSTLLIRDLHVGECGSMNDARVFRRSSLRQDLHFGGDLRRTQDEHLIGDGAYILTDYMMIPFKNNGHLTPIQRRFNRTLSQARVRVENAFARAKGKWRRLKFMHVRNHEHLIDHVVASFVLHNFLLLNGEDIFDEGDLRRRIPNNRILGRRDFGEMDAAAEDEFMVLAQARGLAKREFIMDHLDDFADDEDEEHNENEDNPDDPDAFLYY